MQTALPGSLGENVPATVIGWTKGGGAKVETMSRTPSLPLGSQVSVGIRPDSRGRVGVDFDHLRKHGLRVGGVVLLRRLLRSDDGWTARYVETLVGRDALGKTFVMQEAGACILPPAPGQAIVETCLVAPFRDAVAVRSLSDGMNKVSTALDQPCLFGEPGLLFTGRSRDGTLHEIVVGGDGPAEPMDLLRRLMSETPKDLLVESRTTGSKRVPWRLVPFFRAPIPLERKSRHSAIVANHAANDATRPLWMRSNVVLTVQGDRWHVADATPTEDNAEPGDAFTSMTD